MPRGKNTNVYEICQECKMQNYTTRVNEKTLAGKRLERKKFCPNCNAHKAHRSGKKITHSSN